MKSTNKTEKCKNSKKRPSSLLLVPLCLLLPIWLLVTMPYYMSRNIYSRLKAIFIRSESTLITSQVIDPMDEEISDFETKAWLHLFDDDVVLEAARDHLERTYYKTLNPEYDDPLI
jgi:hypothetical protein